MKKLWLYLWALFIFSYGLIGLGLSTYYFFFKRHEDQYAFGNRLKRMDAILKPYYNDAKKGELK